MSGQQVNSMNVIWRTVNAKPIVFLQWVLTPLKSRNQRKALRLKELEFSAPQDTQCHPEWWRHMGGGETCPCVMTQLQDNVTWMNENLQLCAPQSEVGCNNAALSNVVVLHCFAFLNWTRSVTSEAWWKHGTQRTHSHNGEKVFVWVLSWEIRQKKKKVWVCYCGDSV